MNKVYFWICICIVLPGVAIAQSASSGNAIDPSAMEMVGDVLTKWDVTLTSLQQGEMEFQAWERTSDGSMSYTGVVGWEFPMIRWEFNQVIESKHERGESKYVIVDSPREIITHNTTARQAFRSWEGCKPYSRILRLAPWQSWSEYDGQVPISDVLSIEKLLKHPEYERTLTAKTTAGKLLVELGSNVGKLSIVFDASTGALLEYTPSIHTLKETRVKKGRFEWKTENSIPFPVTIEFREWDPSLNSNADPKVRVTTSNHKTVSRWKKADYTFASLDRGKMDSMTEFYPGNRPSVTHKYRKLADDEAKELRKLGESASAKGFARGPR